MARMGCYVLVLKQIKITKTKVDKEFSINARATKDCIIYNFDGWFGHCYCIVYQQWRIYFCSLYLISIQRVHCDYYYTCENGTITEENKELIEKLANCDFYGVYQILKKYEN
jgi:hypothetical protein